MSNESDLWVFLKQKGLTDVATAAIMGNIKAESNFIPNNLEGAYESKLGYTDATYTAAVDNGTYTKEQFIRDSAGYGLAQWTFWSRKEGLYNYWKANYPSRSIGDLQMQMNWLWAEMGTYPGLINTLQNFGSICEATSYFMINYEKPADQGSGAQARRCQYSIDIYERYTGSEVPDPDPDPEYPAPDPIPTPNPNPPSGNGICFYITVTNREGITAVYLGTQIGDWIYFNDLRHYRMSPRGDRFQIFMRNNDWKEYSGFQRAGLQLISINPYIWFDDDGGAHAAVDYYPFLY